MPYYTVNHVTPLTVSQKDALATRITDIHATRFRVLRNFVNVRFQQLDAATDDIYVGGRRRVTNHVLAEVRAGPSRTQADWNALCAAVEGAWEEVVVRDPAPRAKGSGGGEEELVLRGVFVLGSLIAGSEAGVPIPGAGEDEQWIESHWGQFVERAERGEREWVENVKEARERGMVDEAAAGKSAQQRLEEMLGWGDAA